MSHNAAAIAQAFQEIIAAGDPAVLVDERGEPAVATVPMGGGAAASLVWNPALGSFVASVTRPVSQIGREAAADLAETLAELTIRTRFGSRLTGGLTDDGRLSVSAVINGTSGAAGLSTFLTNSLALLTPSASAAGAAGRVDDLVAEGWIRV